MNTLEVEKQTRRMARIIRPIFADATGSLPTRFQLLKVGVWDTPNHGIFIISQDDLLEYKANYEAGIAQVVGKNGTDPDGIMIDYNHESEVAGGWIKGMVIEGDTLWADPVKWSSQGIADLQGENYKYISPEFYPKSRGGWPDPEQYEVYIPNVIAAASLVNRPLFKGLDPIMARADGGKQTSSQNIIYISASAEGKHMPTLEEVRAKDPATLSEDDKKLIVDNKDSLTADEKVKFGLESAPADPEADPNKDKEDTQVPDKEAAEIAASVKRGESVVVKASVFNQMQKDVKDMKLEKITASVTKHVARGAIKADQMDKWAEKIMADASAEELLKDLPGSKVMASEIGNDEKSMEIGKAQSELHAKVAASATDPKFKGQGYAQRRSAILADPENAALAASIKEAEEEQ